MKKIALLATGDELVNGDILNTNGQVIAQSLFDHAMQLGMHLVVSDDPSEIQAAISYLLQNHDGLIITGGLGPTSDDQTRFALAAALNKPLVFDEATWENILHRFQKLDLKNQPDSNRQQALFPEGAIILPNEHGTAPGCWIESLRKCIAMLPGPPGECLPIFNKNVLTLFENHGFVSGLQYEHFLLFGPSEGKIAHELDAVAKDFSVRTGYRLRYPYVEFKVYSENRTDLEAYLRAVHSLISPYLSEFSHQTASEALLAKLPGLKYPLRITDMATHGRLQMALTMPHTWKHLEFSSAHPMFEIHGLDEFWQASSAPYATLRFNARHTEVPNRGMRTLTYAVEWTCLEILKDKNFRRL